MSSTLTLRFQTLWVTRRSWVVFALLLTFWQSAAHAEDVPELFLPAKVSIAPPAAVVQIAKRSRPVFVNRRMLDALDTNRAHPVKITLFDGKGYTATLERAVVRGPRDFTWFGNIPDVAMSSVQLTVRNDILIMTLNVPGVGIYATRSVGKGIHFLLEHDPAKAGRCGGAVIGLPNLPDVKRAVPRGRIGIAATTNQLDIIVFYTTATRDKEGGSDNVITLAQAAIDQANSSFTVSLCNAELRLLDVQLLSGFVENNTDYGDMLSRFRNDSTVKAERDFQGADLCSLLVSVGADNGDGTSTVGFGDLLTKTKGESSDPSPPDVHPLQGFTVVHSGSALAGYVLAHEVGHNLGCGHSLFESGHGGCYTWSHGAHFKVGGVTFGTIMAYALNGVKHSGYYSNPDVSSLGVPTGDATDSDNARTIRITGPVVAANREVVIFVDKNSILGLRNGTKNFPYTTVTAAIDAAPSGTATPVKIYIAGYGTSGYNTTGVFSKNLLLLKWSGSYVKIGKP